MNVLIILEDFVNDESMVLPIVRAMMTAIGKPQAKVAVCKNPRLRGHAEALRWEKIQEILERYGGMTDLFLVCVDRDGNGDRRAKLDGLEKKAQEFLAEKYQSPKKFLGENAWQELEVWVLAGCEDIPKVWKWSEIRSERKSKTSYFMRFAEQRSLLEARCQGRGILAEEASKRYDRIRQRCPEDIQELEKNIRQWCELSK
ncbi:hypothetical protein [Pseudanabaena minima]|uniref:hypothetical protein n=1 Tax=Pseudanabaena minima TaxID=890415 RepID=UPI003DA85BF6